MRSMLRPFLITSHRAQNGLIVNGIRTAIPSPTSACTPERGAHFTARCGNSATNQALLLKQFPLSLKGNALEWYMAIPPRSVADWDTMATTFFWAYYRKRTTGIRRRLSLGLSFLCFVPSFGPWDWYQGDTKTATKVRAWLLLILIQELKLQLQRKWI